MRAIRSIITLLAIVFTMASCSTGGVEELAAPGIADERIDLVLEGAFNEMIALESPSGLISFSKSSVPFLNENEYTLRMRLDGGHFLDLVIYRNGQENPLGSVNQFSAYPLQIIEDKQVYVIVNYTDSNGAVLYSTTTEFAAPLIQVNILEISSVDEYSFSGRLRDVVLYEVHDGLRSGSQGLAAASLKITGSFKSNNL